MEYHIIEIVRFAVCILSLAGGLVVMIKSGDRNALRRITALLSIGLIYFNEQIGQLVYLALGSTIETLIASLGVVFVISLTAVIALFPIIAVVRWLTH